MKKFHTVIRTNSMISIIFLLLFFNQVYACSVSESFSGDKKLVTRTDYVLKFAQQQLRKTLEQFEGDTSVFPDTAILGYRNNTWYPQPSTWWTSGYFPGMLWLMYEITDEDYWRENAETWTKALEKEKNNTDCHDVGLMIGCSFGNALRMTKEPYYKDVMLTTANSFSKRFNPVVGCTRSLGPNTDDRDFIVIIDNMVCLELLFKSSELSGIKDYYNIAHSHALKTIENHIRDDHSTYHWVIYDPVNGAIISKRSHQGYALESCWSRGQAWAIHGFTMAYRFTKNKKFLKAAQQISDYFINNLPDDHIPYWDFNDPKIPNVKRDTSAATVAASGLFELSGSCEKSENKQKYFKAAENILRSLCYKPYLSEGSGSPAILLHMVGSRYDERDKDKVYSHIYGDYYLIETIQRYRKLVSNQ